MENGKKPKSVEKVIVSYVAAQKLKSVGFILPTLFYYLGDKVNRPADFSLKNHNEMPLRCSAPTYVEAVEWLDEHGYFIYIRPEFYEDGVNWVWCVNWYKPKEEWLEDKNYHLEEVKINDIKFPAEDYELSFEDRCIDGTPLYGDNNEYPTRKDAIQAAVEKAIELFTENRKIGEDGKK